MMKVPIWITAVALAAGFGAGWLAKPAPEAPPEASAADRRHATRPAASARPAPTVSDLPPPPAPPPADAGPATLAERLPDGVNAPMVALSEARKMREQAKMLRLVETLELTPEQQDELRDLIERAGESLAADPDDPIAPIQLAELEKAGALLAGGLSDILTPDQRSAFEEMLDREERNRIEAAAHGELAELTARVDLNEEQREQALARLRDNAGTESAGVPKNLALMLDTSVLPVGAFALSREAVPALRAASGGADAATQQSTFLEGRHQELEARFERIADLLTPAQRAAYEAAIREKQAILDQMRIPR